MVELKEGLTLDPKESAKVFFDHLIEANKPMVKFGGPDEVIALLKDPNRAGQLTELERSELGMSAAVMGELYALIDELGIRSAFDQLMKEKSQLRETLAKIIESSKPPGI